VHTPIEVILPEKAQEVNDVHLSTHVLLCKFVEFVLPFDLECFVFLSFYEDINTKLFKIVISLFHVVVELAVSLSGKRIY
jgi:hypothetical protein